MKRHIHSRVGATLLFLLLFSLPAAAQISDVYVLPAMGNTPGAGGTYWVNDFHIMNPQSYPLKVTLTYIPTGAGQAKTFTLTINSNETQWAENILEEFGIVNATGSLLVWVDPDDNPTVPDDPGSLGVIVASRSFNDRSTGTVGQGVPGVMTGLADYDLDQISAIATGVNNWGAINIDGFRTNVGGVNLSDVSTTLWVSVIDDGGTEVARRPFAINPGTHYQEPLPTTIEHGTLEFWVQFPNDYTPTFSDLVIPYASVVDNRTGDPTYLNPTLLAVPGVLWGKQGAAQARTPARVSAAAVRGLVERSAHLGEAQRVASNDGKARILGPGRAE
ncbi:MAG TPA: hypothetical protein VGF40_12190 [Thermoanaerobaculia bacterium]